MNRGYDPLIIDIHTRKLRYYVAVAEELHFSRAAARVHLAQQALSRQIKELEDELGVRLLDRTTRRVTLTPAGQEFLEAARAALAALDAGAAAVRRTGRALSGTLRLGFAPGAALELTAPIMTAFRESCPDVTVQMREFPASDPSAGLASGVSDVAFVRLPQATNGIEAEVLFVDPVVAMMSTQHRFAGRSTVTAAELVNEPLTLSDTPDETYRSFWRLDGAREDGVPPRVVPVSSVTEEAQLVATGAAVAITSSAMMRFTPLPGLCVVPIAGWPGSRAAVAWHSGERAAVVARFVDTACTVRDREAAIVELIERPPTHP